MCLADEVLRRVAARVILSDSHVLDARCTEMWRQQQQKRTMSGCEQRSQWLPRGVQWCAVVVVVVVD